jgi:ATP-binding cassette subfamily B protein
LAPKAFLVVYKVDNEKVYVSDPDHGQIRYLKKDFIEGWQNTRYLNNAHEGLLILFEPTPKFHDAEPITHKNKGFKSLLT